jgi:hypothetical protein
MSEPRKVVRASDEHTADRPLPAAVGLGSRAAPKRESSPHAHRFRAATAVLIGLAVGAIIVIVTVLSSNNSKPAPAVKWSDWSPPDSGDLGAREIADHIAPLYRISAVDQLAVVTVVNLASPSAATSASGTATGASQGLQVAVRPDPRSSAVSLLGGQTIAYNLCGIGGGSNCAIGVGTPSANRLLLLRREALELALYTFKYLPGVSNVVAILPPGYTEVGCTGICSKPNTAKTQQVDIAVLFVRDELKPWLQQPLAGTFPEQFPPTISAISSAPEAGLVDQITARGLFSEKLVQAQDGSNLIVLDPLPPS